MEMKGGRMSPQPKKADKETVEGLEGVTPTEELVDALDEPAGSPVYSGAAPGVKAATDEKVAEEARAASEARSYDQPKATEQALKDADEVMGEVRDIQWDVRREGLINVPPVVTETVYATLDPAKPDKDPASLTITQAGGQLVVSASGPGPFYFSREDALAFQRAVTHSAVTL
jgi:hypothetical protein